jgi:hypothetical protein
MQLAILFSSLFLKNEESHSVISKITKTLSAFKIYSKNKRKCLLGNASQLQNEAWTFIRDEIIAIPKSTYELGKLERTCRRSDYYPLFHDIGNFAKTVVLFPLDFSFGMRRLFLPNSSKLYAIPATLASTVILTPLLLSACTGLIVTSLLAIAAKLDDLGFNCSKLNVMLAKAIRTGGSFVAKTYSAFGVDITKHQSINESIGLGINNEFILAHPAWQSPLGIELASQNDYANLKKRALANVVENEILVLQMGQFNAIGK